MKAIFYDRNMDLVRCQFAGMNEKGEPNWLIIEQGEPTETLAETERKEHRNQHFKLLCLEGEEVGRVTLMKILCSFIESEIEGWGELPDDIEVFVKDMIKHRVVWNKDSIGLRFRICPDYDNKGMYYLSIQLGTREGFLGAMDGIKDLDWLLELIDDFCCLLEDEVCIEKVNRVLEISDIDEHLFSENLLARFEVVIK